MNYYVVLRSFDDLKEKNNRKKGDFIILEDKRAEELNGYSLKDPLIKKIPKDLYKDNDNQSLNSDIKTSSMEQTKKRENK